MAFGVWSAKSTMSKILCMLYRPNAHCLEIAFRKYDRPNQPFPRYCACLYRPNAHCPEKSLSQNLFSMTNHLYQHPSFHERLGEILFHRDSHGASKISPELFIFWQPLTLIILQEVFINTPAYLINNIYTGICLIIDGVLNAMEQCIVYFPIHVAKEVYKELPEEIQFAAYNVSSV